MFLGPTGTTTLPVFLSVRRRTSAPSVTRPGRLRLLPSFLRWEDNNHRRKVHTHLVCRIRFSPEDHRPLSLNTHRNTIV